MVSSTTKNLTTIYHFDRRFLQHKHLSSVDYGNRSTTMLFHSEFPYLKS